MSALEFNQALLRQAEFLKPFAISLTRDSEDAKDLFQETLSRAIANWEKYNIGTNIKAWLYTIMRNIFINDRRKKIRNNTVFYYISEDLLINSTRVSASNGAIATVNIKEIQLLIRNLPEIFKTPFLLHFDGFKYHEISRMLSEPLGTIKSRIHLARKLLRSQISRF